ncbi:hypothetical protein [Sinobaca sp. H24]|uniref:hypothetical protein n=1 Tax=Sinobaca sp. H24 TaxID=2923376 RepID=UPI00207A84B7|nr:hypothetical protein [Sinobaca sp. H24]
MDEKQAYEVLRSVYTNELMMEEKRRVLKILYRHLEEQAAELAVADELAEGAGKRVKRYKEYAYMPGNTLLKSVQFVFNTARGDPTAGEPDASIHVKRIYKALYQAPAARAPVIPDYFWRTPLGVACLTAEQGIAAVYDIIEELEQIHRTE